MEFDPMTLVDT